MWSVQLNPRPAGGPYNLTVSVQETTLMLADVLFGDIWLCGGQSNMAFTVPMVVFFSVSIICIHSGNLLNLEK